MWKETESKQLLPQKMEVQGKQGMWGAQRRTESTPVGSSNRGGKSSEEKQIKGHGKVQVRGLVACFVECPFSGGDTRASLMTFTQTFPARWPQSRRQAQVF